MRPWYIGVSMEMAESNGTEPGTNDFILIGKFIATFSQLEFLIRLVLCAVLRLKSEHLTAVVSYDFAMLCAVTSKVLQQEFPEKKSAIEKVFNKCRALNDDRVRIAHSLWMLDTDGLIARHLSRQSLDLKIHYKNPGELQQLIRKAEQLKSQTLGLFATSKAPLPAQTPRSRKTAAARDTHHA